MEDPAARRARLKALREAADAAEAVQQPQQEEDAPQEVLLKFRNYNPVNQKDMVHEKIAPAQVPKLEVPIIDPSSRPEEQPQEELLLNIAPKKANWDLKRDIQGQLDKLERRTQKAIVEIIQEDERKRFEAEGGAVAVEQG